MTHLELENLASEFLEGQLDAVRRVEVEAHLKECAGCRELIADVRHALELCQSAEELEPAPWLISKIMLATVGERKPTFFEQLAAFFRPQARMRVAYAVGMTVFSLSVIINAAGVNLRHLTLQDLSPRTWIRRANSTGHMMIAHAEKYYYDLRVVYEIESRLRQFRRATGEGSKQQQETPKTDSPVGGTSDSQPPEIPVLAKVERLIEARADTCANMVAWAGATRSSLQ
jgi:hypothetical protein